MENPTHSRRVWGATGIYFISLFMYHLRTGRAIQYMGSWLPDQRSNPSPPPWKPAVLTTGPPASSLGCTLNNVS